MVPFSFSSSLYLKLESRVNADAYRGCLGH
jgi:hypothetical protein